MTMLKKLVAAASPLAVSLVRACPAQLLAVPAKGGRKLHAATLERREFFREGWAALFTFHVKEPMEAFPGQFVTLRLPGVANSEIEERHYSLAGLSVDGHRFQIGLNRVEGGYGSNYLLDVLQPGHQLVALSTVGKMQLPQDPNLHLVFIATGTGVMPFRWMIQSALQNQGRGQIQLFFGSRFATDIYFGQEFQALQDRFSDQFDFVSTLSRPPESWTGRSGYVQQHVRKELAAVDRQRMRVFACGLKAMIVGEPQRGNKGVREILKDELGLPEGNFHQESYDAPRRSHEWEIYRAALIAHARAADLDLNALSYYKPAVDG